MNQSREHPIGLFGFLLLMIAAGAGVLMINEFGKRYEPTLCARAKADPMHASKEVLDGCNLPDPLKR